MKSETAGKPPVSSLRRAVQGSTADQRVGLVEKLERLHRIAASGSVISLLQKASDDHRMELPVAHACQTGLLLAQPEKGFILIQLAIDIRKDSEQLDFRVGIVCETLLDAGCTDVEELLRRDRPARLVGGNARIAGLEHTHKKIRSRLFSPCLSNRDF